MPLSLPPREWSRPTARTRQKSYSALLEWGGDILDCIHELDLALWYSGSAKLLCAARLPAGSIGLETDGLAEILLRHENSVLSSIQLNFIQRDYRRTCQVIGTDGTIYWDFAQHRVDVYAAEGKLANSIPEPGGWQTNQMYVDELSHFLTCAESNVPTINSVSDALAPLEIALAARSQRQN